jgi:GNAT superfamily N-acetyltransferase
VGPLPAIRPVRPDELSRLPALERAADTLFEPLGIGPLPGPGTVEEFAAAAIVLVAGDPPVGLCRIDRISGVGRALHLEQLSVHPEFIGRGIGRALLRAGVAWARDAGQDELTLITYRDVPWNGPFYRSEGFVEIGPADDWLRGHGLAPEEPLLGAGGARIAMARTL